MSAGVTVSFPVVPKVIIKTEMAERDHVANQLLEKGKCPVNHGATTSNGAPVDSLTASMTVGPRGDIVLKDFTLIDHLAAVQAS